MPNIVEFILKMQDMMSGPFTKVIGKSNELQTVLTEIDNKLKRTGSTGPNNVHRLTNSYSELERKLQSVKQKMNETTDPQRIRIYQSYIRDLNRQMSSHPTNNSGGGAFSGVGKIAGALGLTFGAGAALNFAKESVGAAMDFGATQKSFGVLTGSNSKGRDIANQLNALQQNTILGPEVFQAAQTMMSFGITADKVVGIEKQLGDVSMGNKDKFNALTLAFSQTQAAGRLMGQDLLQYINAGFNPLQVMSEKWSQFGFKQKVSVGQLKEMMEKGQITSAAVAKSFEVATSSGGKFNNMMNQIADTSFGKMQILQGQWENFKIGIGNALMPLANSLMSVANTTLGFLDINKTAPQILMNERAEMNTLVSSIVDLNSKNVLRGQLLQNLVTKYPDFFGKLNEETGTNERLLSILNKVNDAYSKRISLASSQLAFDVNNKTYRDAQNDYVRNYTILQSLKKGDRGTARSLMDLETRIGDVFWGWNTNMSIQAAESRTNASKFQMDKAGQRIGLLQSNLEKSQLNNDAGSIFWRASQVNKKSFGANTNSWIDFQNTWSKIHKTSGQNYTGAPKDIRHLQELLSSINVFGSGRNSNTLISSPNDKNGRSGRIGSDITSGGPRTININFNKEFINGLSINSYNVREGVGEMERMIEDGVRRILLSAAQAN